MLDFRTRRSVPSSPLRQQRGLLTLLALSVVVLWMMAQAAQPGLWRVFFTPAGPPADNPDTRLATLPPAKGEPDTFVTADRQPEAVDQASAPAKGDAATSTTSDATKAEPSPTTPVEAEPAQVEPAQAEPAVAPARTKYFPGVRPDYLGTVRDDTVLRGTESDAWFHLLQLLGKTDPAELARHSLGQVGFSQLFKQTQEYRGQLVTLHGTVRRATRFEAPMNSFDVSAYYQLWLEPTGGPPSPIVLYALELPPGFPTGDALEAEVSATGFFFKRWAYKAQDAIRTAPLVLVRSVEWRRPAPPAVAPAPEPEALLPYVVAGVVLAVVSIAAVRWRQRREAAQRQAALPAQLPRSVTQLRDESLQPDMQQVLENRRDS